MKKTILVLSLCTAAFSVSAAEISPVCQEYFKAIDAYVEKAPDAVKQQMQASKDQIAAVPASTQEMMCKQSLEQLKQMPKM